jgi:hypothetical protein
VTPRPFRGPWLPPPSGTAMRAAPEFIVFTMQCPGCGQDAKWRAERDGDKSLLAEAVCPCQPKEGAA